MAITPYATGYNNYLISSLNPAYRNNNPTNSAMQLFGIPNDISGRQSIGAVSGASELSSLRVFENFDSKTIKTVSDLAKSMYDNGYRPVNPGDASETKDYLTTIKSASQSMKNSLSALMGATRQSVYTQVNPVSSDTSKLTVDSSSANTGVFEGININIDQIATAQINKGDVLAAEGSAGGPALYEFKIESDGYAYSFFINADSADTNETIMGKIAKAINDKNIGISVSVEKDAKSNTSALTVQSKETGNSAKNQFSITDVYGDLIAHTGVGVVTQQAQDAIYRINSGDQKTSSSNTIDIGSGVKATMLKASGDTINVSMKTDTSGAVNAVKQLVSSYNDLISTAKSSDTPKALQLNYQLASAVNTYATSLNRIGVTMDTKGTMSVDMEELIKAAENGALASLFKTEGYSNFGFANRMNNLAGDINANPMKYTDLSSLGYANFNNNPYSPFQNSRYNQVYNTGLFLNMFI